MRIRDWPIQLPICFIATLALLLVPMKAFTVDSWNSSVALGDRITFDYPTWLTADEVQWLINDREQAIAFVESFLGWAFQARVRFTVETSLVARAGHAVPTSSGGDIVFAVPHGMDPLVVLPWTEILPGGCHEEVHLITARMNHWTEETMRSSSQALLEGLATYVNAVYRQAPVYQAYAAGLLQQDALPPLDQLLALYLDFDSTQLDRFAVYHGGASFLEYLDESFGRDTLLAVYAQADQSPEELLLSLETHTVTSIKDLDARWREHIGAYPNDLHERGTRLLDLLASPQLYDMAFALSQVSQAWRDHPLEIIGPSKRMADDYDALQGSLHELACDLDDAPLEIDEARCSEAILNLSTVVDLWAEAIETYQKAIDPPFWRGEKWVRDQLTEALTGYQTVGDLTMVERVQELLADMN